MDAKRCSFRVKTVFVSWTVFQCRCDEEKHVKRFKFIAVMLGLIMGATLSGQAAAVEPMRHDCTGDMGWGQVCFESTGDHLVVYDDKADGYRVIGHWWTDYGREEECHNVSGAGSMRDCNYNMKEGRTIYFRAILSNGSTGHIDYSDTVVAII